MCVVLILRMYLVYDVDVSNVMSILQCETSFTLNITTTRLIVDYFTFFFLFKFVITVI